MFDILKKDIKIGDKVKLYLITGKEPEGTIVSIGDDYVLLQSDDKIQNRFFDKLIGGWDVISSDIIKLQEKHETVYNNININKSFLLENVKHFQNYIKENDIYIPPNANIIEVMGTTCIAANSTYSKILILNNKIVDYELIKELEEFQAGGIIPVVLQLYQKSNKQVNATVVAKPQNLSVYTEYLSAYIINEDYGKANILTYLIKDNVKVYNKELSKIIRELKKAKGIFKTQPITRIEIQYSEDKDEKQLFKNVEKGINELIRQSKYEQALAQIHEALEMDIIDNKYKSSLLLKKAQMFSSIGDSVNSEKAYIDLVHFNELHGSSKNNLSHLYTELARIQSLKLEKQNDALLSIKKALIYNPQNNYAINLLKQFEGKDARREIVDPKSLSPAEHLLIEAEDDSTTISKMIDLDIKEHKYTHAEIIKVGGIPTAFIANKILYEAKRAKEGDLSERYPLYLEAAKAFSELNIGSYDLQDYLESIAYYAMLKGNSIFISYKNRVLNNDIDVVNIRHLRDSACSYYLESLNLLSNIDPNKLLVILSNYLKMNLCMYHLEKNSNIDLNHVFKGQFADVLSSCLGNNNEDIERIAYSTIIAVGASSTNAWNKLNQLPKGTGRLYNEFYYEKNRKRIYKLINNIENNQLNEDITPGEFLKNTFTERKRKKESLVKLFSNIINMSYDPYRIEEFIFLFRELNKYERLFTTTDEEIKAEIESAINIMKPYLTRSQAERTNILIQSRNIFEKIILFINNNTTYYGRSYYYSFIAKWKKEIDKILEEKISQSYPVLEPIIDPPYYLHVEDHYLVPLLIINRGEATSDGYEMHITYKSFINDKKNQDIIKSTEEISSDGKVQAEITLQKANLEESKAIELKIEICSIYQNKILKPVVYEFTIEPEPDSILMYDDIPWKDGPIPKEHLFKGRKKLIADLAQHYLSNEKEKPYILYGLTRTGKSSILQYLQYNIEGDTIINEGREKIVLPFRWELNIADSYCKASDFWNYLLYEQTYNELQKYANKYKMNLGRLNISENNVRAKDFKIVLDYLDSLNIYPIFFVDEFSFIKSLIDKHTINPAFLHTLRQYSLDGLASFIFAGTYDIKELIKDPKYGITGQLVHAIDEQINEISDEAAEELIQVMKEKLSFTPEAIKHIKFLSGKVPYFIQIICKNCGYYACENKRRIIGYPELEKVVRILVGVDSSYRNSFLKKLTENTFQNNQYSPADPKEVNVLLSSITYFNKDRVNDPRGVSFAELQKLWADKNVNAYRQRLADSITLLLDKKILVQEMDDGMPVYKILVDIFRRWWMVQHPDINLVLTTLND